MPLYDCVNFQELNRNLTEIWAPLSNWTDEAVETMSIAGYYVMEIQPGLKVMAINSNYGYVIIYCEYFLQISTCMSVCVPEIILT